MTYVVHCALLTLFFFGARVVVAMQHLFSQTGEHTENTGGPPLGCDLISLVTGVALARQPAPASGPLRHSARPRSRAHSHGTSFRSAHGGCDACRPRVGQAALHLNQPAWARARRSGPARRHQGAHKTLGRVSVGALRQEARQSSQHPTSLVSSCASTLASTQARC
jgi:hypothetical protein